MADFATLSPAFPRFLLLLLLPPLTARRHCSPAPPLLSNSSLTPSRLLSAEKKVESELFRRRSLTFGTLATVGAFADHGADASKAHAFSFGISGPKEWLKEQKRKASKFLLAPISASHDRLTEALVLLTQDNSADTYLKAKDLVKIAARDCKPVDSGSFASFQANTGVEVCTFRLVFKNAASLLDNADPVKQKADMALKNLVGSLVGLDEFLMNPNTSASSSRDTISKVFKGTFDSLDEFEACIRNCLGI